MNFGPGPQGGFYNALAIGQNAGNNFMQAFQQGRQVKEEREGRNALSAFVTNPNEQTAAAVAPYKPELAYKFGQDQRELAAQEKIGGLVQTALNGKPDEQAAALNQLAVRDLPTWKALDARAQDDMANSAKLIGDVALDLRATPYAQRRDKFITYAQQFPQFQEQLNQLAFLPEDEQTREIDSYALKAGLVGELRKLTAPETFNVGPGEGRYSQDPVSGQINTIIQPNYGGAPAFSPAPAQGGGQPSAKTIAGVTYYQNPQTGQWFDNPQEAGVR